MEGIMSLVEALEGAKIVRVDSSSDLVLAWFGGHGVHVYNSDGNEVAFWSCGDWSKPRATPAAVRRSMNEHIRDQYFPS